MLVVGCRMAPQLKLWLTENEVNEELKIYVSYSQFAVFCPELNEPFSEWTDEDVEKGFVWRPGSVSFRTTLEAGEHVIRIYGAEGSPASHRLASSISVPFIVPESGLVELGSISDTQVISVEPGSYRLTFELINSDEQEAEIHLSFAKS